MHSTACGVGASSANSTTASMQSVDGLKMVHNNDDAMNKIPLKSASGLDDEEKNGGEFINDTETAAEARREQMRANLLKWMKKLTIVLICFIGIALISYVIISLCFSDDSNNNNTNDSSKAFNSTSPSDSDDTNGTHLASFGGFSDKHVAETTTPYTTAATKVAASMQATTTATTVTATSATATTATTAEPTKKILSFQDVPNTDAKFESKLGVYKEAAVCSDKEVCSQIGSHILSKAGSAVDSAIATLLCNGLLTMQSMGIGGGMLMNVFIKDSNRGYSIDAREVAPFAAYPEMFDNNLNASLNGGLSIAVPGELMGYQRAHERFGKLPWKALVEPSIKLCHEGFYMTHHMKNSFEYKQKHMKNNTIVTNLFVNDATGEVHPVGTKLQPPKELCETLELLAENGPLDFYNGTLSKLVVADLKELGSTVTADDLEAYRADLVSSITMQLGDDVLYAVPPVSSGSVVANILSILEGYNFTKEDMEGDENVATTMHRFAEAMKFGFAKRWELGDLRFNDVRELVSKLTSPDYGHELRMQINDSSVLNQLYDYGAQFSGVDDVGTSHIVVLAPNGDAVSVTSSVNDYFGSGLTGKRTGILFNSGMNDFSIPNHSNLFGLPPAPSNFIDARKRSMSSMSPMILTTQKGDIRLVFGSAGGSMIISSAVEVAARVLWFGQNIKEAIDAPRFHHQLQPNVLSYQKDGFSEEVIKLLEAKGHQTNIYQYGSAVCGIARTDTGIYANADYRKRGGTAGF